LRGDLVAAANVLSGLFQGFITGGVASQSAANDRVGAKRLRDGIRAGMRGAGSPVRVVLLDLSVTPALDIESVNVLGSLRHELAGQGIDLWLGGVHAEVAGMLDRSGLADDIGRDRLYRDVEGAVSPTPQPDGASAGRAGHHSSGSRRTSTSSRPSSWMRSSSPYRAAWSWTGPWSTVSTGSTDARMPSKAAASESLRRPLTRIS
jgi:MFS superfamily sulfate permease-like transporter